MGKPWDTDFFPPEVWNLMTNLGLLAAIVAVISSVVWLWKRGPALLIKYGSDRMTSIGNRWEHRRNGNQTS